MDGENLAKIAWAAYADAAENVTYDGKPLPKWEDLGENRQMCWRAAAVAVGWHTLRQKFGESKP